jgi:N utilization substance protein A
MKSDFMLAINQLCSERKLSREVVMEAVEASLISAYKRNFGSATNIEVKVEPSTGDVGVYAAKEVVEVVQDPKAEISIEKARDEDPDAEIGMTILIESTPRDFGRIAAQTAKQVILQRIREAERDAQYSAFADSAGEIAHGTIQSMDFHSGDVIVNLDGAEALLPSREQVPRERYRRGMRLRAYVLDVRRGNRGPQITLSRRSAALLRRLLELEVPEIHNGSVEIKAIAREAGSRSKVAVHATQDGVDPVGSCVGVRGGRIQNVVNELGGEKIDVVQWDAEVSSFIANALSPAKVMNVLLEEDPETGKTATVIVPDRQLSLAIGKEGQNARLAAKLTSWRIDIKSATEAAEETLGRLEDAEIPPEDMDLLSLAEAILRKRQLEDLSEEERTQIEAEVEKRSVEDVPEPEEASVPETEPDLVAEAESGPETAIPIEKEAPYEAGGLADPEIGFEEPDSDSDAAVSGLVEEAEPVLAAADVDEEELEPTFEGEPIEDSLGWVVTQPEEEYYTGWGDVQEEVEEEESQFEWVLEDPEDVSEERKAPAKDTKKGKKRRGRRSLEEDLSEDEWRW